MREMHTYVCAGVPKAFQEDLKRHPVILGTKGFQEWVYKNFGDKNTIKSKEISRTSKDSSSSISPMRVLENVAHAYNVKVFDLRQSVRGMENEGRNVAVYLMRRFTGLPLRDIASWFNCSSMYTVATIQKRVKEKMTKERKFQRKIKVIENSIRR